MADSSRAEVSDAADRLLALIVGDDCHITTTDSAGATVGAGSLPATADTLVEGTD